MSRAYRIAVSETLRRHVKVDDGVQTSVELLPILPADRMCDLLAAELEGLGFERDGQTATRVDEDGTVVTVDLEEGTVTVRQSAEAELDLSRKGTGSVYDQRQTKEAEKKLRERLKGELEKQAEARTEDLRQEVTEKLERKLKDLQQEIDGAVNRASAGALKEKAASMGEIEEISEDSETGSLTIRVRV
jgi:frataxin-like iron-binding protein CyaY